MISTPAGGWYVGAIDREQNPPVMVVLASSPGHPLQPGDRFSPPPTLEGGSEYQ